MKTGDPLLAAGAASAGVLMANVPQTIRFTVSPNAPRRS
jgi:hypothetical protein